MSTLRQQLASKAVDHMVEAYRLQFDIDAAQAINTVAHNNEHWTKYIRAVSKQSFKLLCASVKNAANKRIEAMQRYTVRAEYTNNVIATFDSALCLLRWYMQQANDNANDTTHNLNVCIGDNGYECPLYDAVFGIVAAGMLLHRTRPDARLEFIQDEVFGVHVRHSFYSSWQWAKHEFKNPDTKHNAFAWLEQLKNDLQ